MGACYDETRIKAKDATELVTKYRKHQVALRQEHGHQQGYNGTMSECELKVISRTPMSLDEARDHCEENVKKYEAKAIPIKDKPGLWYIGACCPC